MKRRGILAAAGAVVAGIVAKQTSQPVGATSGGGPDGPFVLGSNFIEGNSPNTTGQETVIATDATNFPGRVLLIAEAANGGGNRAVINGIYGHGKGIGTGVTGVTGGTILQNVGGSANAGVAGWGIGSTAGYGVYGWSDVYFGGWFEAGSGQGVGGVAGVARHAGTVGFQAVAYSPATDAGYFVGNVSVYGSLGVTGGKFAVVKGQDGQYRGMYAVESPECWFEDAGQGTLVNGIATIKLDPLFAQHIHTDTYHIFLTEHGENNALHVASRTATGFRHRGGCGDVEGKGQERGTGERNILVAGDGEAERHQR